MKIIMKAALLVCSLLVIGCFPEEHFWWSADGSRLAVLTPTGLRWSNPDGALTDATCEGVQAAAFFRDSSNGFYVMRQTEVATWDAAKALVPVTEAKQVEDLAKGIPELAAALAKATDGNEDKLEPLLKSLGVRDLELLGLAYNCALQTNREAVAAAVTAHGSAKMVKDLLETKPSFKVNQIALVMFGGEQGRDEPFCHSLFPLGAPVPSPKHDLVAFTAGKSLRVAAPGLPAPLEVTDANLGPCAWTPDGLSLVYLSPITPVEDDSTVLAKLCLRTVAGADGKLLQDTGDLMVPETCPPATTLATVAVSGPQRLAVLPDGRILFASMATTFPAAELSSVERLFLLDPALGEKARPVPVPVDPAVWPGTLQHFVVSPDSKRVALVEGNRDAVAVIELATGKIEIVAPDRGRKCRSLPAWRSNDELSFAALPGDKSTRPEVMLRKPGQPARVISGTWSDEIVNALMEESE